MADPWSSDLAALGEHSRRGLRSLDATRAALAQRPQETKMRFFKKHPALAALLAILVIGLFAPLAYAVVHRVFLTVDPQKPASEIEADLRSQLQSAGVNASVHAEKTDDGKLRIGIMPTDPSGSDVDVVVNGGGAPGGGLRVEVHCLLDPTQMQRLQAVVQSDQLIQLFVDRPDGQSDDDLAAAIARVLADQGFHGVEVRHQDSSFTLVIKSPPT